MSELHIKLHVPEDHGDVSFLHDLDGIDSEAAALSEIGTALSSINGCEFVVGGFGQPKWPVDVYTDLVVVIEQLPQLIRSLRRGEHEAVLDFYEQGIEREITFNRDGDSVSILCSSATGWSPAPSTIVMPYAVVLGSLERLRDDFLSAAERLCPGVTKSRHYQRWKESFDQP